MSRVKMLLPHKLQGPILGSSRSDTPRGKHIRGGTLQLLSRRARGRQKLSGVDPLAGRWVWSQLVGAGGKVIKMYTVYRSCKPPPNVGDKTWHSIQVNKLTMIDDPLRNDPRAAVLRDLTDSIGEDIEKGISPIVMMDANSSSLDPKIR